MSDAELLAAIRNAWVEVNEECERREKESRADAERWKSQNDWYGWNFHEGLASGTTWCRIFFHRIRRLLDRECNCHKNHCGKNPHWPSCPAFVPEPPTPKEPKQ